MAARPRIAILLWILLLAASRADALVLAGPPFELPSDVGDIEVQEGVAYLATASGVSILDVSDPGEPPGLLGSLPAPLYVGIELEVHGDLVYLAAGSNGLRIIDVTDPANPTLRGVLLEAGTIGVEVVGTLAYVVTDTGPVHLRIVDVSDPAQPVEIGSVELDADAGNEIAVTSGIAYVAGGIGIGALSIVDIADPLDPSVIGSLDVYQIHDLEVHDGLLYAAGWDLSIFDLANPAAPALLTTLDSFFANDIEVVGHTVHAVDGINGEFDLLDVSDPANPVALGVLAVGDVPTYRSLAISGDHAFVIAGQGIGVFMPPALWTVDLKLPQFPRRTFPLEGFNQLKLVGDRLYAADIALDVYDTSEPLAPVLLGSSPSLGIVSDLEVGAGVAFVAVSNGFSDMRLVDVSDPALPVLLQSLPVRASALALQDDRLYVGTRTAGLEVYDLSDPTNPVRIGSALLRPGSSRPTDLDLDGTRLYVTTLRSVEIFDVSDASAPVRIGAFDQGGFVFNSAPTGDVLYTSSPLGFLILDVSDPTAPSIVSTVYAGGLQADLEIVGDRLFVGGVVRVFDISDPIAPMLLGGSGFGSQVETSGGVVYATGTGTSVLFAIDFGPEYAPSLEVEIDVSPADRHNRVVITEPGYLLVGIFGSPELDVLDVDPDSLGFGPAGAPSLTSFPFPLNRDRRRDLLSIFWIPDTGIALSDTEVCLTGETRAGRRFQGCDAIQPLAGCGHGYELALLVPLLLPLRRAITRRPRPPRRPAD